MKYTIRCIKFKGKQALISTLRTISLYPVDNDDVDGSAHDRAFAELPFDLNHGGFQRLLLVSGNIHDILPGCHYNSRI